MPKTVYLTQRFRTKFIKSQNVYVALSLLETDPKATTVIFYPGTVSSPIMYSMLLHELFFLGVNVVGVHPLSHGLSPNTKKDFTFDDILQNGKDAENFAREHFSGPLVVCGHSQGGILALAHSLNNDAIKACFSIGTLLPHKDNAASVTRLAVAVRYKQKLLAALQTLARSFPLFPIPFFLYLDYQRILANAYKVFNPENNNRLSYPLSFIASLFNKDMSQAENKEQIRCPFFLFSPRNDELFSLNLMQDVFKCIVAEQKKLIMIEGGGHLAPLSRVYAKHIAAHIVAECAGLGLHIHTPPTQPKGLNS